MPSGNRRLPRFQEGEAPAEPDSRRVLAARQEPRPPCQSSIEIQFFKELAIHDTSLFLNIDKGDERDVRELQSHDYPSGGIPFIPFIDVQKQELLIALPLTGWNIC